MHHDAVTRSWTPRSGVAAAEQQLGTQALVGWCCDLLTGRLAPEDPDGPPLTLIAGAPGRYDRDRWLRPDQRYWPRVWAVRALRYVWAPAAEPAVLGALVDESWRVREHACAVVRLRELGVAGDRVAALTADPVLRVRAAACAALGVVGEAEHAVALHDGADDGESPWPTLPRRALHRPPPASRPGGPNTGWLSRRPARAPPPTGWAARAAPPSTRWWRPVPGGRRRARCPDR